VFAVQAARGIATDTSLPYVIWSFLPSYICALLAVVPVRIVYGLGQQVQRARELGNYVLEEPLGSGGMGQVFRATHQHLARPAAVKLIRPEVLTESDPDRARVRHLLVHELEDLLPDPLGDVEGLRLGGQGVRRKVRRPLGQGAHDQIEQGPAVGAPLRGNRHDLGESMAAPVRRNDRKQARPRRHQVHLVQAAVDGSPDGGQPRPAPCRPRGSLHRARSRCGRRRSRPRPCCRR